MLSITPSTASPPLPGPRRAKNRPTPHPLSKKNRILQKNKNNPIMILTFISLVSAIAICLAFCHASRSCLARAFWIILMIFLVSVILLAG